MPATILPFERRDAPRRPTENLEPPPTLRAFPLPSPPTSRQMAHRWAMLAHLRRHSLSWRRIAAPSGERRPDPVR
jgi:hypothetical protein